MFYWFGAPLWHRKVPSTLTVSIIVIGRLSLKVCVEIMHHLSYLTCGSSSNSFIITSPIIYLYECDRSRAKRGFIHSCFLDSFVGNGNSSATNCCQKYYVYEGVFPAACHRRFSHSNKHIFDPQVHS